MGGLVKAHFHVELCYKQSKNTEHTAERTVLKLGANIVNAMNSDVFFHEASTLISSQTEIS